MTICPYLSKIIVNTAPDVVITNPDSNPHNTLLKNSLTGEDVELNIIEISPASNLYMLYHDCLTDNCVFWDSNTETCTMSIIHHMHNAHLHPISHNCDEPINCDGEIPEE
jgi:hypothetical protein